MTVDLLLVFILICVLKQKAADELRISDWSSDVCSSDLLGVVGDGRLQRVPVDAGARHGVALAVVGMQVDEAGQQQLAAAVERAGRRIGIASCRGRVGQYG